MSVALIVPLAMVGLTIRTGLEYNPRDFLRARRVVELSQRVKSQMLIEQEVTLMMLLDEDALDMAPRKIDAYDKNIEILEEIEKLTHSPEIIHQIHQIRDLDAEVLRSLDTQVLEQLFAGNREQAVKIYFPRLAPVQHRFEDLIQGLSAVAEGYADSQEQQLGDLNRDTLQSVVLSLTTGLGLVAIFSLLVGRSLRSWCGSGKPFAALRTRFHDETRRPRFRTS